MTEIHMQILAVSIVILVLGALYIKLLFAIWRENKWPKAHCLIKYCSKPRSLGTRFCPLHKNPGDGDYLKRY